MNYCISFFILIFLSGFNGLLADATNPEILQFESMSSKIRAKAVLKLSFKTQDTLYNRQTFDSYYKVCEDHNDQLSKVRLMLAKYRERINFGLTTEEEAALLKEAILICEKNDFTLEGMVFNHYYQFFLYYNVKKDADKLFVFVLKEFEDISKIGFEAFMDFDIGRLLGHSGRFVYDMGDDSNALKILSAAEKYIHPNPENMFTYIKVLNNIQVIHQNFKNYEKAIKYATSILESTKRCQTKLEFCHFWQGLSRLDMAEILLHMNKQVKAEQLAEEGYSFIINREKYNHNIEAEYDALTVLIRIKLKFKKYKEAEKLLGRQKIIFDSLSGKEDFYFKKLSYYDQYADLAEQNKDFALAISYTNLSKPIRDSLNIRNDARKIEQLNQKHKIQTLQNNLLIVEKDKKINIWFRNAALLLLLFGASLFYIRYLTIRNREREKEKQLEIAKTSLTALTENLQKKAEMLEQLSSEIAAVHTDKDRQSIMDTLHQHTLLKDEDWHEFKALFEKVHPNYINELKESYPDITPAEIRILVLEKLNFSLQAMANTLGVGKSTIHQTKYRLKKKVGMLSNPDFE